MQVEALCRVKSTVKHHGAKSTLIHTEIGSDISSNEPLRYRDEIDGLRAVAVMAVVLCHAKLGVPGGFVGVDVFFVISGYLITSIVWRDLEQGTFSFSHFWERRARRIIPALAVLTAAVLWIGSQVFLPADFKALGASSAVQSIFGANIYYLCTINYFAPDSSVLPLLHTWSLAVEEQFYLLAPFVLFALHRTGDSRAARTAISLLAVLIILSLSASAYLVEIAPSETFYLLPTRAWEMMIGSALALFPHEWLPRHRIVRELASLIGLTSILVPCFLYTEQTRFPGSAALSPCIGAALFIWANSRIAKDQKLTQSANLLALRPVVFIGKISYSLYLWHWPVLVFFWYRYADLVADRSDRCSIGTRVALVGLGIVLSILSWRFVETPFRNRTVCKTSRSMFLSSLAALLLILGFGTGIYLFDGIPNRFPSELMARDDKPAPFNRSVRLDEIHADRVIDLGIKGAPNEVFVWGDSFCGCTLACFDDYLKSKGLAGKSIPHAAVAPVLGNFGHPGSWGLQRDSIGYNEAVFDYIVQHKIKHVVMIAYWYGYRRDELYPDSISVEEALLITVNRLVEVGVKPWLVTAIPCPGFDAPRAMFQKYMGMDITPYYQRVGEVTPLPEDSEETIETLKAAGCEVLDPRPYFEDSNKEFYLIEKDGHSLFFDWGHVTTSGAHMLFQMLEDAHFAE